MKNFRAALPRHVVIALLIACCCGTLSTQVFAQDRQAALARTAALQGEYVGWVSGGFQRKRLGVQLVARGLDEYSATLTPGGLPGAGATLRDIERVEAETRGSLVIANTANYRIWFIANQARVMTPGGVLRGVLTKVHRSSPTMGAVPPPNAIVLFDGSDTGELVDPVITADGLLEEGPMTRRNVRDFFLHTEFRIPFMPEASSQARGNSGLYLQRRYEVQILDSFGLEGGNNECGALYQQRRPSVNACFPPGAWQTYDVEFRAARYNAAGEKVANARITVRQNGITIHNNVELRNKTGAGRPEGPEPLPILFQDHSDPVRFRNIWLIPRAN